MAERIDTIDALRDRLGSHPIAMITTADDRGTFSSRPLTVQEMDMTGNVRFLVDRNADWMQEFKESPANASFTDEADCWVSVAGRLRVVDDPTLVDRYSSSYTDAYFGEDSEPIVLEMRSDHIEWWAADGRLRQLFELAKAKVTRTSPDLGESGTIET